jgi:hypothetical protein
MLVSPNAAEARSISAGGRSHRRLRLTAKSVFRGDVSARIAAANAFGVYARPRGVTDARNHGPAQTESHLPGGRPFAVELSRRIPDRQQSRRPNHGIYGARLDRG